VSLVLFVALVVAEAGWLIELAAAFLGLDLVGAVGAFGVADGALGAAAFLGLDLVGAVGAFGAADGAIGAAAFLGIDLVGAVGAFGAADGALGADGAGLGGLNCFVEVLAGVEDVAADVELAATFPASVLACYKKKR
jgi:hypothetical protein